MRKDNSGENRRPPGPKQSKSNKTTSFRPGQNESKPIKRNQSGANDRTIKSPTSSRSEKITNPIRKELPMAPISEEPQEFNDDGLTYIAYGEQGEDLAFELSDNIDEAIAILGLMQEDGFKTRLFQAQEIEIVAD